MDRAVPRALELPLPRGGAGPRSGRAIRRAGPGAPPAPGDRASLRGRAPGAADPSAAGGTRTRGATLSAAAALALAVALGAAAPEAAATATQMRPLGNINFGSSTTYGTGCTYTVQVLVDNALEPVTLLANGIPIGVQVPDSGNALFTWVPAVPGPHRLAARQAPDPEPTVVGDVRVGTGLHLGYACLVNGG
ncbi:hypothetical protein [Nocardia sp. NPDC057353]|uniref:hypothetical protein n=1 Tax=Nocardia sp. NPDC057353 TaxID=3346104 RepID=UPI00363397A4